MFELRIDIATALRHFSLLLGSAVASFVIAVILTPYLSKLLDRLKLYKTIRENAVDGKIAEIFRKLHLKKEGTPTMGGILIWGVAFIVVLISVVLTSSIFQELGLARFSLLNRNETYLPLFTLGVTAVLGLIDDYLNVRRSGSQRGIAARWKMLWLLAFALLGGLWFHFKLGYDLIHIPGFGNLELGKWYIPLFVFIIVASANAVNITDGLDGLAGGLLVIAFFAFGVIAYLQGLLILAAFCAVIVGAALAFLWFNIPPALFFMGDTGALSLGATLGVIAMLTNSVLILPFIAFVFVLETVSVIIQLISKKLRNGKKVFLVAPLHHHFEAKGWTEGKVVMRFWILGGFMAALGVILEFLSLLKV